MCMQVFGVRVCKCVCACVLCHTLESHFCPYIHSRLGMYVPTWVDLDIASLHS